MLCCILYVVLRRSRQRRCAVLKETEDKTIERKTIYGLGLARFTCCKGHGVPRLVTLLKINNSSAVPVGGCIAVLSVYVVWGVGDRNCFGFKCGDKNIKIDWGFVRGIKLDLVFVRGVDIDVIFAGGPELIWF